MIEFRPLSNEHPALKFSPLLNAACLTLRHAEEHGSIGLTQTKAFKRTFVKWAAEQFDWPGMRAEELFRYNKVLNEYDFPPLEVLHFLLIKLKLGRHHKGVFKPTKLGKELAHKPADLFHLIVPFYLFQIDHSSYGRFDEQPFGTWDVWLNVMNVEIDQGASERHLFRAFYGDGGEEETTWRDRAVFSSCVLRPLAWSGLLFEQDPPHDDGTGQLYFITPLWHSALKLDLDDTLAPIHQH